MASEWTSAVEKLRLKNVTAREFISEFLGTLVLIVYGDCAFALYILEGKGVPDVFGVTWAWGVGVILGVCVAGNISGGHINPAVTVAFASVGKLPWKKVPVYMCAQYLGGFVAAAIVHLVNHDALNSFDPGKTVTGQNRSAWVWSTYPKDEISIWNCFVGELVCGFMIMFTILAIIDHRNLNVPKWLWPLYFGFMIQASAMVFGLNCMAPINPARDFATRVYTAIAGWGKNPFAIRGYGYWWIGIVGPHIGTVLGAWGYYLGIEMHWPNQETSDQDVRRIDTELKERKSGSTKRLEGVY